MESEWVELRPLDGGDFEKLFAVASDPLIWEQHPHKDRYRREVFEAFFQGAMESKGAFLVSDRKSGQVIGSSRYYEYDPHAKSVAVGYTFLARACWGTTYNRSMKKLMLDHAFGFVEDVYFHVGQNNIRSQKAMEKLGAEKVGVKEVHGEQTHFLYRISARAWNEKLR